MPPDVGKVTFREGSEQWLAVAATQVRPRTLENHERGLPVAAAGLPAGPHSGVRFRDLRQICAGQWRADGHDMFSVSRWLGRHSTAFTDAVDAHVAPDSDYTAAIERTRRAPGR